MILFHFCNVFKNSVNKISYIKNIYQKINNLTHRKDLKNIGGIEPLAKGMYLLRLPHPQSRVVIEEKNIQIDEETIKVYFVRDYIDKKKFDGEYGRLLYSKFKNREWIESNPTPEDDIENFKTQYIDSKSTKKSKERLPESMSGWINDFTLHLNNEIFESVEWVQYALNNNGNGMSDKQVLVFRLVIEEMVNSKEPQGYLLNSTNDYKIYSLEKNNVGVLYSRINIGDKEYIILHDGADLTKQNEHWTNSQEYLVKNQSNFSNDLSSITRNSFRSYPKWTITDDDLWFAIEKSAEVSNLSLTSEQKHFFEKFKFPYYINGQAGSGKSTMLYYLFSNVYYYKCMGFIKDDVIFITENEVLLENTKEYVHDLLTHNPEFSGLTQANIIDSKNNFNDFKNFLLNLLDEDDKVLFPEQKYLYFSRFKSLYESSNIPKSTLSKYSAEESWFAIITYIYGYDLKEKITHQSYTDKIPNASQSLSLEKFKGIEETVLPFYEKLLKEGYWDKLKIIRYIDENINLSVKEKYAVIVCDETQDFCRVELQFILKMSKYLEYKLLNSAQVPVVFAGDPNQTVNPTGFKQSEMTSLMYNEIKSISGVDYDPSNNLYNPVLNYRSTHAVVSLANYIQYYRMSKLHIEQKEPQEAKRPKTDNDRENNLFFDYESIEDNHELKKDLIEKLKYKIFIVPVDSDDKETYQKSSPLLIKMDDAELKTSVEAKGAEYKQVVLYGFGEHYLNTFDNLDTNTENDIFRRNYFFNKLYVAITRAQTELIIIDSKSSMELFWKKLVDKTNVSSKVWKESSNLKEDTILYNCDSVNNMLDSTPENAKDNAQKDMEQGRLQKNPSRLKVAADQFFKLDEETLGYECLAISESLKYNYMRAAKFYVKIENFDQASQSYFEGRFFQEVELIGNTINTIEQKIRVILSSFLHRDKLIADEIDILTKYSTNLNKTIKHLEWRAELLTEIILFSNKTEINEVKRSLVEFMKSIVESKDINLYREIANLSFSLGLYQDAVDAFEEHELFDERKEDYINSKLAVAKQNNNVEGQILFCAALLEFKDETSKKPLYKNILDLFNGNNLSFDNNEINGFVFRAIAITEGHNELILFTKKIEPLVETNLLGLIYLYQELLKVEELEKKKVVFILERLAKAYWKYYKNFQISEWINDLNKINLETSKLQDIAYKPFTLEELQLISSIPSLDTSNEIEHISEITIKNFRRFDNLSITNLGQFNLIVGDNNAGKTSLLEALVFTSNPNTLLKNLIFSYIARKNISRFKGDKIEYYSVDIDLLDEFLNQKAEDKRIILSIDNNRNNFQLIIKSSTFEKAQDKNRSELNTYTDKYLSFEVDNKEIAIINTTLFGKVINSNEAVSSQNIPYGKGFDKDLVEVYFDKIDKHRLLRDKFIVAMKIFIPNIDRIIVDTHNSELSIEEVGKDSSAPLHQFGDGANKLFRILVQITLQENKKLTIDEIDAGIHYTHFVEFWNVIILTAEQYNVQIFATTHNIECIKYFNSVLENKSTKIQDLSRIITVRTLSNNNVKAYTRIHDEFEYEITNDYELRAGGEPL